LKFYDREAELDRLAATTSGAFSRGSRFTVMTGRRRVGKTEILRKHIEGIGGNGLYFFVGRKPQAVLLQEYRAILAERFPDLSLARFSTVADLLDALLRRSAKDPTLVVLDEFQNFIHVDPSVYSDVQRVWDAHHSTARCHLAVAGSTGTLMSGIFEGSKEPLYGRATDRLPVLPFAPSVVQKVLDDNARGADLLSFFSVFGGIPRYYELVDRYGLWRARLGRVLSSLVLDRTGVLYSEGREILMEEFGRDHQVYFSVLSAIAAGCTQMTRIADACGIPVNSVGKYLDQLQKRYDLIERVVPVLERGQSRGIYVLKDPFLRFWFRYVHRNASFLELGAVERVAAAVLGDMPNFLGPSFEHLCREVLVERSRRGEAPFRIELRYAGRWWAQGKYEIDVVAGNDEEAVLMECKLSPARLDRDGLGNFLESCEAFGTRHPHVRQRRVCITWEPLSSKALRRPASSVGSVESIRFADLWTR